jgi:hypothetical protein
MVWDKRGDKGVKVVYQGQLLLASYLGPGWVGMTLHLRGLP